MEVMRKPYPALTSKRIRKTAATGGSSSASPFGSSRCSECPLRRLAVDMLGVLKYNDHKTWSRYYRARIALLVADSVCARLFN